jgi:hypothetical protein
LEECCAEMGEPRRGLPLFETRVVLELFLRCSPRDSKKVPGTWWRHQVSVSGVTDDTGAHDGNVIIASPANIGELDVSGNGDESASIEAASTIDTLTVDDSGTASVEAPTDIHSADVEGGLLPIWMVLWAEATSRQWRTTLECFLRPGLTVTWTMTPVSVEEILR